VTDGAARTDLPPCELLDVWETGLGQHPLDRFLTILVAATPGANWESLASDTIGRRDARLLHVRAATFGSRLQGVIDCPACGATVELSLDVDGLQAVLDGTSATETEHHLVCEPFHLVFRLPTSRILATALTSGEVSEARVRLIELCVVRAERDGSELPVSAIPDAVFDRLASRMAELDPGLEITFDVTCVDCEHGWQAIFDIGTFLWQEISAQARRLLRETAILARAYGWREADILALGSARRQAYLDLVP
jgi:hypothetical protein